MTECISEKTWCGNKVKHTSEEVCCLSELILETLKPLRRSFKAKILLGCL
jgi:hypothetical protein